jgi:hypothetical protein
MGSARIDAETEARNQRLALKNLLEMFRDAPNGGGGEWNQSMDVRTATDGWVRLDGPDRRSVWMARAALAAHRLGQLDDTAPRKDDEDDETDLAAR